MMLIGKTLCFFALVLTNISHLAISNNDRLQQYIFLGRPDVPSFARFLPFGLLGNYTVRSKIECMINCAEVENCFSLEYRKNACAIFNGYPQSFPLSGIHHMINRKWCNVPDNFVYVRHLNLCYKVITKSANNCSYAKNMCLEQSAHLIEIDSLQKQIFFQNVSSYHSIQQPFFLSGIIDMVSLSWRKNDGSIFTFTKWDEGFPLYGDGKCVAMSALWLYFWRTVDSDSSDLEFRVICEKRELKRGE